MALAGLFGRSAPFIDLYTLTDRLAPTNLFLAFDRHLWKTGNTKTIMLMQSICYINYYFINE